MTNSWRFIFFGAGPIALSAISEIERAGLLPALVVTTPDRPVGRGKILTESPIATWAHAHDLAVLKPENINEEFLTQISKQVSSQGIQAFVVIDYGKILPKALLDIPKKGVLNMHPSLLPRLRGPSPIRSAILKDDKETGVSVMLLDEKMDHGPILAQRKVAVTDWPPRGKVLDALLATEGGKLVAQTLPLWLKDEIEPQEQNHDVATYTQMFSKEDGLLDLDDDAYQNLLKISAFEGWPGTYFFAQRNGKDIRVKVLDAHIEGTALVLDTVIPEGKGEMSYQQFQASLT